MGYAGYTKAKLPPPRPTEVQAALAAVQSLDSLEVIGKLLKNVAVGPTEEKFRKCRLSNAKLKAAIADAPGALAAMLALGWVLCEDGDTLTLPRPKNTTMAEVREVQAAQDILRKAAARRKPASSTLPVDAEQARIRSQMEADRLERLAKEPSKASVAQPLSATPMRMVTAGDIGIGKDE